MSEAPLDSREADFVVSYDGRIKRVEVDQNDAGVVEAGDWLEDLPAEVLCVFVCFGLSLEFRVVWEDVLSLVELLADEDLISEGSLLLEGDSPETTSYSGQLEGQRENLQLDAALENLVIFHESLLEAIGDFRLSRKLRQNQLL